MDISHDLICTVERQPRFQPTIRMMHDDDENRIRSIVSAFSSATASLLDTSVSYYETGGVIVAEGGQLQKSSGAEEGAFCHHHHHSRFPEALH